jgi:hypothetical protein
VDDEQRSYLSIQKKKDNCTLYFNQLILTCVLLILSEADHPVYFLCLWNPSKASDIFAGERKSYCCMKLDTKSLT